MLSLIFIPFGYIIGLWVGFKIIDYQKIIKIDDYKYMSPFNCSKEKAGLMFVMQELYNKKWNGEDWIANA